MGNESMGYTELGNMQFNRMPPKKNENENKGWIKKGGLLAVIAVLVILLVIVLVKLIGDRNENRAAVNSDEDDDRVTVVDSKVKIDSEVEKCIEIYMDNWAYGGKSNEDEIKKQYPKFMDETIENICDAFKDEFEELEDVVSEYDLDIEDVYEITYKITDKTKLDSEEMDEYRDEIIDYAGGDEKVKIKAGYLVDVEIKMTLTNKARSAIKKAGGIEIDNDDAAYEDTVEFVVLECNGKTGIWKEDGSWIWELY